MLVSPMAHKSFTPKNSRTMAAYVSNNDDGCQTNWRALGRSYFAFKLDSKHGAIQINQNESPVPCMVQSQAGPVIFAAFETKGFVLQYRPSSISNKKFQPKSLLEIFVGMESNHTLCKIFALSKNRAQIFCQNYFTILHPETTLSSIETLISEISIQKRFDEEERVDENQAT